MAHQRQSDADLVFDDLTGILVAMPVWVGPLAIVFVYALFRFVVAAIFRGMGGEAGKMIAQLSINLAWLPAMFVLVAWIVSLILRSKRRRQFDRQTGLASIRQLSWREFESLIGEAFRRQGYTVKETGQPGPDGGVDIVLTKGGEETLVQCKRWREWTVGVKVVRELYGVMAARGSTHGIVVSSGNFSKDARRFSQGKSLTLIDGHALAQLIAGIQATHAQTLATKPIAMLAESVLCPACGSSMTVRTAKKGPQPGSQFWGCTKYPACRGTRPFAA